MKYLIYDLFSGVGFCNQLFSLETAIYLANITNRKLILLIKHPLCHCGRASWDYGNFLDLFSNDYREYLPEGIETYYKIIPEKFKKIITDEEICYTLETKSRFSNTVFIDTELKNNIDDVNNFCSGREKHYIDFENISKDYIYVYTSNASRCFYNFYTTKKKYILMSNICYSLTNLNQTITSKYTKLNFDLSIHLRLGDYHISKDKIDAKAKSFMNFIDAHLKNHSNVKKILVMSDRQDSIIIDNLKKKYHVDFTQELIETTKNPVVNFLLEKYLCYNSRYFIGTVGSTVTNYINYIYYFNAKPHSLYTTTKILANTYKNNYSWKLNDKTGPSISWSIFWEDNIYRSKMLTCGRQFTSNKSSYIKIVKEINITPNKNKKIISFCLYGLNDERNRRRHFDKGVYINYHYMKNHNYKDWIIRVYIPHNEPSDIIENIKQFGDIEIVLVDTNTCLRALRFLPNDDPNVKVWISRDLDSIINTREEKAVEDWLKNKNNKELMIMSDYYQHTWTIAGGMFGKINNDDNDIIKHIVDYSQSNNTNIDKFANDCIIAENYFYKENNYIQYYRAGKKLKNSVPFPDLSTIHCSFVGNISPILKYYTDLQLEKVYPFLSNKSEINENNNFLYNPWKCFFKNSQPLCSVIWKGDDLIITVDTKKTSGLGTWKTLNGDGKKLLELNTHIQILWEDKKYIDAYMPNKETICVKHGDKWYNFLLQ